MRTSSQDSGGGASPRHEMETTDIEPVDLGASHPGSGPGEEPFRAFVEATDDLVTIVDRGGQFLYVNPAAARTFGFSAEECRGRSAFDFIHSEDRERTRSTFRDWLADPESGVLTIENRQVGTAGAVRTFLWTIARVEREPGQLDYVVSSARDVTAARRLEAEANAQARYLRALMKGMLDAVITIDPQGIIQDASDAVESMFGYTPEELQGRNIKLLMPEPYRSEHDARLEDYRRSGESRTLNAVREFEVLKKDGSLLECEVSLARIDVPGQKQPLYCGVCRDISLRKRTERALEETFKRLRGIFDQEFQYVGLLDPDGTVLEMNETALRAAGLSRDQVVGKPFWQTRWWASSEEESGALKSAIARAAAGEFVRFELEILAGDGGQQVIDFSLKPVRGEDGRVELLIPEGRDITRLKEAQQRELAMLRALATIGESAAVLAHEIKNPITAVNLALRAVADQIGEDQSAVLEDLVERMRKLERTMRRTLSFARPLDLDRTVSDCQPLLAAVADAIRPQLEQAGIALRVEVAADCPRLWVDVGLVEELLSNLILNAVGALGEGGQIALAAAPAGDGSVEVLVDDDGPGIPESLVPRLFKPFSTTKSRGTGLGLAICKKIAEEHGGSIEAGTSPLGGARFRLRLPSTPRGLDVGA